MKLDLTRWGPVGWVMPKLDWPIHFGPMCWLVLCVVVCCCVLLCVVPLRPSARPPVGPLPCRTTPPLDRPKFCSFFPLPHHFRSFCLSLWMSSRWIFVFLKVGALKNVHVWALRLSCETPGLSPSSSTGPGRLLLRPNEPSLLLRPAAT